MTRLSKIVLFSADLLLLSVLMTAAASAQMRKVKTVWVILMENHNWTGNNAGSAFGAPDIQR